VIQANCNGREPHHSGNPQLLFQEYDPEYPHEAMRLGIAGVPGGPDFYINLVNNVRNHGPGGQGPGAEPNPCFGKLIQGEDIVGRMRTMGVEPGAFMALTEPVQIHTIRIIDPSEYMRDIDDDAGVA